jgi:hypothetical protein
LAIIADEVMEAPDTWQLPFQTDEMGAITERQNRNTDAYLLGRAGPWDPDFTRATKRPPRLRQ